MRMMFIVLIWALAAFTTTAEKTPASLGCDKTFKCYVPSMCMISSVKTIPTSRAGEALYPVDDDCPAIIRFHAYTKYWLHVSIESFIETTNSVVFTQRRGSLRISEFSCAKVSKMVEGKMVNMMEAKFNDDVKKDSPLIVATPTKINCEFIVKLNDDNDDIFKSPTSTDKVTFKVDTAETQSSSLNLQMTMCDPTRFEYQPDASRDETYKEVKVEPGKYYCEKESVYKMQYRKEGSDKYDPVDNLKCKGDIFEFDGVDQFEGKLKGDEFKIRCFAYAKFFCDFEPKCPSGRKPLKYDPPNLNTKTPSKLNCPHDFPHLIIEDEPIVNPKFECKNFGGSHAWTIHDYLITKEGPEVYCTNEVQCHRVTEISEDIVDGGTLDNNYLPRCAGDGELRIGDKNVTGKRCDKFSGKFKYTVDGEEKEITKNTKFNCLYKQIVNNQKNQENTEKITKGGLIGAGVCVGVVVLVFMVGAGWMYIGVKRDEKKCMNPLENDYKRYAMNSGEKAADELKNNKGKINKKQQQPQPSSSEKPLDMDSWNDMIQWMRQKSVKATGIPSAECPVEIEELPEFSNTDESLKQCSPIPKNLKKPNSERNGSDLDVQLEKWQTKKELLETLRDERQKKIDKRNRKNKKK